MIDIPHPMLASLPRDLTIASLTRRGWWFEEKLDGVRGLAVATGKGVRIFSRRRRETTDRWPELAGANPAGTGNANDAVTETILDGEIVVLTSDGRVDYPATHRRDGQVDPRTAAALAVRHPATFVAFDVLVHNNVDLRWCPYTERMEVLDSLVPPDGFRRMARTLDGEALWAAVTETEAPDGVRSRELLGREVLGREGVVAKSPAGTYEGGRSTAWVKFKNRHPTSCIVTGWDSGEGARAATFGSLRLGLVDDAGAIANVGRVGTGWDARESEMLWGLLRAGEPFVVDVLHLGMHPASRRLRSASFVCVRPDVELAECARGQLA
jgi:bifunctional non-homologous end joining protein LigD